MSLIPQQYKKNPRYLEDITYTVATQQVRSEDPFSSSSNLFMGRYDERRLMRMLDRVGIIGMLHNKGYRNLVVSIIRSDDYTSRLYVNFDSSDKETRLIELIVREGLFKPVLEFVPGYDFSEGLSMLLIEWVALQDPKAIFSPERPRLPGQQFPGIGALNNMQKLFNYLGRSSRKDAIVDVPEYFHSSVIYSKLNTQMYNRMYSFFSPEDAGIMQAMLRDIKGRPLADVSFAVALDCLIDAATGERVRWRTSEQVYPFSKVLKNYFEDKKYKLIAENSFKRHSYAIDWERFEHLKAKGLTDEI